MRIFIFKSQANSALRAFAGEAGGQKLPSQFGPWHAIGVIRDDKEPPFNVKRDVIEKAIAGDGYQLFKMKSKKEAVAISRPLNIGVNHRARGCPAHFHFRKVGAATRPGWRASRQKRRRR